jgi:hypothetical protein
MLLLLLLLMQIMVLFYEGDSLITDLPEMLQPLVKKVLVPLGKLLGFKPHYPSHRSAAQPAEGSEVAASQEDEEKDEL